MADDPQKNDPQKKDDDSGQAPTIRQDDQGNFKLVIDGAERTYTPAEMGRKLAEVQKGIAAEERFQQAANLKKTIVDLVKRTEEGDAEAYAGLLREMGYDAATTRAKVQAYLEACEVLDGDDDGDDDGEGNDDPLGQAGNTSPRGGQAGNAPSRGGQAGNTPPRGGRSGKSSRIRLEDLDEDLQKELREVQNHRYERLRQKIYRETEEGLAKDRKLRIILEKGGSKAGKLKELAKKAMRGRIRDGAEYGPELVKDVVAEVRGVVEEFGVGPEPTSIPGLGFGPGIAHAETQAEKPPEPVSILDSNYRKNLAARLAHRVFGGGES